MRFAFPLALQPAARAPLPRQVAPQILDEFELAWDVDHEGYLAAASLTISGVPITFTARGAVATVLPELRERAFRVMMFFANMVFTSTLVDAVVPALSNPTVSPETQDEEREVRARGMEYVLEADTLIEITRPFRPEEIPVRFQHSSALVHYAEALRVVSPFTQFEQFYKVLECFFEDRPGETFVRNVSQHALQHNPLFTYGKVWDLRNLRNRISHPRADLGPANPEDLDALEEVERELPSITDLAWLLIEHPPVQPQLEGHSLSACTLPRGS